MDLMAEIRATVVDHKSMAVWFLGQNGWAIKTPAGKVLVVDPYLSDSCNPSRRGLDVRRRVPVPFPPERLEADLLACTHSHRDHADLGSLCPICRSGRARANFGRCAT